MNENYNKNVENCDECQVDFQNEINELVDNVENYSREDHMRKEQEIENAFDNDQQNKERNNNTCRSM